MVDNREHIRVIIPTITKDYIRMRDIQISRVFKYLPVADVTVIGNEDLCETVDADIAAGRYGDLPIVSLNEEELVARQPVVDLIKARAEAIDDEMPTKVRPGWYYQQFLKMAFHKICDSEYYMSWDMDTVPLRPHDMFDAEGRPIFDIKNEFFPGYFDTLEKLLGLKKSMKMSFVSEHMIFKTEYMRELINAIEGSLADGSGFWEKIINSIDDMYITYGFSEFETYGTFVTDRHPEAYSMRRFASFRRGSWFVKEQDVTEDDLVWLAKDYDAVSFENAEPIEDMVQLFRNPKYRNRMSARKFYETILESGYFGEYKDGWLDGNGSGDWFVPV